MQVEFVNARRCQQTPQRVRQRAARHGKATRPLRELLDVHQLTRIARVVLNLAQKGRDVHARASRFHSGVVRSAHFATRLPLHTQ